MSNVFVPIVVLVAIGPGFGGGWRRKGLNTSAMCSRIFYGCRMCPRGL